MYFENDSSCSRTNWKYMYLGEQLLPNAMLMYDEFMVKETECREEMSKLLKDPTFNTQSNQSEELRKKINTYGRLKEELSVYCHEFKRNPNREYHLGMGDIVFFRLNV